MRLVVLVLILATAASTARADPCKAIPDRGPLPAYLSRHAAFSGPVVYVVDGDGLCVDVSAQYPQAGGGRGAAWVEVRLADFYAPELGEAGGPEAKATLARITEGRRVECLADHRSYDRIVARCALGGVSLGDLMRRAGMAEGGRGFPPRRRSLPW